MVDPKLAVSARLDEFARMLRTRDAGLVDALWGDGRFVLVGSEAGEVFRTRDALAEHLAVLLNHPATFSFSFPQRSIDIVGAVAWIVAEGVLTRRDASGEETVTPYLVGCIVEQVEGEWRWRQFFGAEPA